jgi:hypothetical protein
MSMKVTGSARRLEVLAMRPHIWRVLSFPAAAALLTAGTTGAMASAAAPAAGPAHPVTATTLPHGTITTLAGGPGGPGPAGNVSVLPCGVKFARGGLYIGSGGWSWNPATADYSASAVYRVNQRDGALTVAAGTGANADANGVSDTAGVAASGIAVDTCNVTFDSAGNMLFSSGVYIAVIAAKTGTFYQQKMTAGHLYYLPGGYGVTTDVELDPAGNVVVSGEGSPPTSDRPPSPDEVDAQVSVVAEHTGTYYGLKMTAGSVYAIAGVMANGDLRDGVLATRADLGYALGTIRLDSSGNLILADIGTPQGSGTASLPPSVRVVPDKTGTYYGRRMTAGHIYTIAGGGTQNANGVPGTKAALSTAAAVALDRAGNVVIADGGWVRVLAKKAGTFYGRKMIAGDIYTIAGTGGGGRFTDGGPALKGVFQANGVAVDNVGNVLVADDTDYRVLLIAARSGSYYGRTVRAGYLYSVAGDGHLHDSGDGGPATSAELYPARVAEDRPADVVVVTDQIANVVRMIAGRTGTIFGRRMTAGRIYTLAGDRDPAAGYSGDGGPAVKAGLGYPGGVAADQAGNVLLADNENERVRVVAARTGTYYGQKMTAGDIYTIAGDGALAYSGDGGPARAAGLSWVVDVAADHAGGVLLLSGQYAVPGQDLRVRMVAGKSGTYYGQPMTAGDIYTIAGNGTRGYSGDNGPATAAEIQAGAITVDNAGNLVIADGARVRVVAVRTGTFYGQPMTAGYIYTVAGGGTGTGDGVPAAKAQLLAGVIAVDAAGNLLAGGSSRVWIVAEKTGSYYGKRVTAGDVYTVAGTGGTAPIGDGGPATRAAFDSSGVAIGYAGNLLIADSLCYRIRSVNR